MAEENMENFEEQDNEPSKKGLIFSIICFILVLLLLIVGVVLFFIIRDRREGEINIEGTNVNIEATSHIEGMENPPTLAPIYINTEDEDTITEQRWNVDLVFTEKDQVITVYITIVNNNDLNGLTVYYDNATTESNLIIHDYYYKNVNDSHTEITNQDGISLSAGETITFYATFEVLNYNNSVNDTLNITIYCENIEG